MRCLSLATTIVVICLCGTTNAEPFDVAAFDRGGVIELPEGTIEVDRGFKPAYGRGLTLIGKGTKPTHIRLTKDLGEGVPLFDIRGKIEGGKLYNFLNLEVRNVTIETDRPERRVADAFNLTYVVESRFDRVKILGFEGHGIYAESLWDTVFTDVQVARCGSAKEKRAAVHLADGATLKDVEMSAGLPAWVTCNNNHFFGCRFENSPYVLTYLGKAATKNQFVACKWHGQLSENSPSKSSPHEHVVIAGPTNTLQACNLVRSGGTAVRILESADGTIVEACTIQSNDGYGILQSKKARKCQVDRNVFADWEGPNRKGNFKLE